MQQELLRNARTLFSRSQLFRLGCCFLMAGLAGCGAGDGISGINPPADDHSIKADALAEFTYTDDIRASREILSGDWSERLEAVASGADTNFNGGPEGIEAATYLTSMFRFYLGDHYSRVLDTTNRTVAAIQLRPMFLYTALLEEKANLLAIYDTDLLQTFSDIAPQLLVDMRKQVVEDIDEYSVMVWDTFESDAQAIGQ